MPELRTDRSSGVRPTEPLPSLSSSSQDLDRTDYQRWKGRIVSTLSSMSRRAKYFFSGGPDEKKMLDMYDNICRKIQDEIPDKNHQRIREYEVACVMELHKIGRIERKTASGAIEGLTGGSLAVRVDIQEKVFADMKLSVTELAYQFLSEDRRLPTGFLERALIPHFISIAEKTYGISRDEVIVSVKEIAASVGLREDRDVTFERILELKNRIRWKFGDQSGFPRLETGGINVSASFRRYNPNNPAGTPPPLERPAPTPYELDSEDKKYIRMVVDNGKGIKTPRHDLLNRIKRRTLRNKKASFIIALGALFSTVLLGVASGGMAAAIGLFYYIGYYLMWSGIYRVIHVIRTQRAMQQIQLSSNFKLEGDEFNFLTDTDEKRFRTFMNSLRYICSHEALTRIYNHYAEMEKDAEARLATGAKTGSLDEVMQLEEGKARYLHRRDTLKKAFSFYDKLYTTANADTERMQNEWSVWSDDLWQAKFKSMDEDQREALFNKAANDPGIVEGKYHLSTHEPGWWKGAFPQLSDQGVSESKKTTVAGYPLNEQAAEVANLAKEGTGLYIRRLFRAAIKKTVTHGVKLGWSGEHREAQVDIKPYFPKPSLQGVAIFGFFFMLDLVLGRINSKINESRFEAIQSGRNQTTGFSLWRRLRTGREDVATLRRRAKDNLSEFVESVLKLHEYHKELTDELKRQKGISDQNKPYEYMDDYDAAVMILKRQKYQDQVEGVMHGAVGELHRSIQDKTRFLDTKMEDIIAGR